MKRVLCLLLLVPGFALADLRYTIEPNLPAKSINVSLTMDAAAAIQEFRIPAWCPGFYFILKYEDKISDFKAADPSGKALNVKHDQRRWVVDNPDKKPITISYRVLGDDPGLGFFATSVLPNTAFINGSSAFIYPTDHLVEKTHLRAKLPDGWDLATPMDPEEGGWVSSGYDEFVDHPIQMGKFERRKFTVEGIPFEAVFVSLNQKYLSDLDAETEKLRKLSVPAIKMFHGAGFKRYTYFIHLAIGNFSGGLEHRASNTQAINDRRSLEIEDLVTHEYFHAWNVKQIRPFVLGPFDYTQPCRTGNLWFAEGVTDYYSKLHALQSGLEDERWLFSDLAGQISELEHSSMRKTKTVEDASREAWENGGFGVGDLSFYTKGLIIGLLLDAEIRKETHGAKSLDDVMRLMYARYRLPKPGYDEDGIMQAVNEVAGRDLSALYKRMVRTTDPLPYELLQGIGLRMVDEKETYLALGIRERNGVVQSAQAPVINAGLNVGDKIVSINGTPFAGLGETRGLAKAGYKMTVDRGGRTVELELPLVQQIASEILLQRDPMATPEAAKLCDAWLRRS